MRVKLLKECDVRSKCGARLGTSADRYRYCAVCSMKSRSLMIGPPTSRRGPHHWMPYTFTGDPRLVRKDGSRLFSRIFHSSPARRVWMTTRPDENRPYSTAYGFGS